MPQHQLLEESPEIGITIHFLLPNHSTGVRTRVESIQQTSYICQKSKYCKYCKIGLLIKNGYFSSKNKSFISSSSVCEKLRGTVRINESAFFFSFFSCQVQPIFFNGSNFQMKKKNVFFFYFSKTSNRLLFFLSSRKAPELFCIFISIIRFFLNTA